MRRFTGILLLFMAGLCTLGWAWQPAHDNHQKTVTRSQASEMINLRHADKLYFNQTISREAQFLVGHVEFEHKGALMYCDSALYYEKSKSFDAYGNVRMVQGDTLSLKGDVLYYDGNTQLARIRTGVVLKHRETTLYTDSLNFDRIQNVGYFPNSGRLVDKDNQLTSELGWYYPSTREAEFYNNVRLVNPLPPKRAESTLVTDTLFYNTKSGVAHVTGESHIYHGATKIETTNGYYYSNTDKSRLLDRPKLTHVDREIVGDSMHYDGKTHDSEAFQNIEYVDKRNKNRFYGHYALYNDSTGYAEAYDSALCVDYSQPDTFYAHADTFKVFTYNIETDSVYRILHAYNRVRTYRVDIQAVCDSLVYNGKDSCMTMYKDPIVWQDGQQILGEKILAWHNDSTLDSVYVVNQALLVECLDSIHYNQVASKEMHSYLRDGEVYMNEADLNVLMNYHPYDSDSLMIGMVHAESSQLRMFMEERKVQKIWMPSTNGEMFPLDQIPPNMRYLENFAWFDYIRPVDKDDVFKWRGKKSGTELKESIQSEPPKQKLENIKRKKNESVQSETTP